MNIEGQKLARSLLRDSIFIIRQSAVHPDKILEQLVLLGVLNLELMAE